MNRFMAGLVTDMGPLFLIWFAISGMTELLIAITLPYRVPQTMVPVSLWLRDALCIQTASSCVKP